MNIKTSSKYPKIPKNKDKHSIIELKEDGNNRQSKLDQIRSLIQEKREDNLSPHFLVQSYAPKRDIKYDLSMKESAKYRGKIVHFHQLRSKQPIEEFSRENVEDLSKFEGLKPNSPPGIQSERVTTHQFYNISSIKMQSKEESMYKKNLRTLSQFNFPSTNKSNITSNSQEFLKSTNGKSSTLSVKIVIPKVHKGILHARLNSMQQAFSAANYHNNRKSYFNINIT